MEGLAKYKKQFPEGKKIKLLFHTCWTEGAGWPLERIRNELGLEKEDVLKINPSQENSEKNTTIYDMLIQAYDNYKNKDNKGNS
jgi:hypothetical protein